MTEEQILDDYPELEPDDFRAVYEFAAKLGKRTIDLPVCVNRAGNEESRSTASFR
jgi:hypothetical protein